MNKYTYRQPAERLMTIEEAKQLSGFNAHSDERRHEREMQQKIWSWQSVDDVMSQQISDAKFDRLRTRK